MTAIKMGYTAPAIDVLELRIGGGILIGSDLADSVNSGYDESYDLGTI